MTKYAKCGVCEYVIVIYDDTDASDYVCPVDGTTLVVATRTEYMVTEKSAATFIVAASDSLHKERADYVCDGVDDQVEIQAAIESLMTSITNEPFTVGPFSIWDDMDDPITGGWIRLKTDETLSQDIGDKHEGSASLKIVAGTDDHPGAKIEGLGSLDWSGYNILELWVKCDSAVTIRLTIYDSSGNWQYFEEQAVDTWQKLEFDLKYCIHSGYSGVLDWSDITKIHIEARTKKDSFTFRLDYIGLNNKISLVHPRIQEGEVITNNGSTYTKNTDYTIDYLLGEIKPILSGSMASGVTCYADYDYGYGKIVLLDGSFHGRFGIGRSFITLEGQGMYDTTLKLPDHIDANAEILTIAADHVSVRHLGIFGNKDNQTMPSGANWGRNDGIGGHGDFITIEHCYVHDTMSHGIIFRTSAATAAHSNVFRGARAYVTNNRVLFCRVEDTGNIEYGGLAIDSYLETYRYQVIGNYVKGNKHTGGGIGYHNGHSDIISYNIIENVPSSIAINKGQNISIIGNTVRNAGGIWIKNMATQILIEGNMLTNIHHTDELLNSGITIVGTQANPLSDISIVNNFISRTEGHGIKILYSNFVNVSGNKIVDTNWNGIRTNVINDVLLSNNVIRNFNKVYYDGGIYTDQSGGLPQDGIQILNNMIDGGTTGAEGIHVTADPTNVIVKGNNIKNVSVSPLVIDNPANVCYSTPCSAMFMDVLAVSNIHVRSNEDLSAATPITFTIDAQPDVPRTLSWAFDTHAQITEYDMEVIGVDAKGNTVTETWDETAGWSGETSNAFATITSIKMTSRTGTGAADTMDIGITDVLGLSNIIYATGDVFKIKKNNANATVAAAQVNTTYDTYDMSVIGLGATDDFTIWYKSNLNIIS